MKIYTSYVSPGNLKTIIDANYLPIFIVRNIAGSKLIGNWAGSAIHFIDLSPQTLLYQAWRDKKITTEEYKKRYILQISELNLEDILKRLENLKEISGARGIVLLGYGSDPSQCHRRVLAGVLEKLTGEPINEVLI